MNHQPHWLFKIIVLALIALLAISCAASNPTALPILTSTSAPIPTSTSLPTISPVPIATWIAYEIPSDTLIECRIVQTFRGMNRSVVINANGEYNSTSVHSEFPEENIQRAGRISKHEFERLILKFVEVDFFSIQILAVRGSPNEQCAFHSQYLTDPKRNRFEPDHPFVTTFICLNGMSCSLRRYAGCGQSNIHQLEELIIKVGDR